MQASNSTEALRAWLHNPLPDNVFKTPYDRFQFIQNADTPLSNSILTDYSVMRQDYQPDLKEILTYPEDGVILSSGRGIGKSYIGYNLCLEILRSTEITGITCTYVLPTYTHIAKLAFADLSLALTNEEKELYSIIKNREVINPENGNSIYFISGNSGATAARGGNNTIVILDECFFYPRVDEFLEEGVFPTLRKPTRSRKSAYRGKMKWIILSSPVLTQGVQKILQYDNTRLINLPTWVNKFLPPDFVERLRKTMSKRRFQIEVEAILDASDSALISPDDIIKVDLPRQRRNRDGTHQLGNYDQFYVSVDPAFGGRDHGAVLLLGVYYKSNRKYVDIIESHLLVSTNAKEVAETAIKLSNMYQATAILTESNGAGGLDQLMRTLASLHPSYNKVNVIPVHTIKNGFLRLEDCAIMFEHKRIRFAYMHNAGEPVSNSDHDELVSQVLYFDQNDYKATARDTGGGHYDLASAMTIGLIYLLGGEKFDVNNIDLEAMDMGADTRTVQQQVQDFDRERLTQSIYHPKDNPDQPPANDDHSFSNDVFDLLLTGE
ncbi:terminase large subunit domain-containing protein [Vibrio alginolyticus]|uniref:terminase large subunit domain-containing protein n=1 Tax=Vibrio alginolyticus TaxID=663 RepID=UPI001BD3029B|nr:terminase family protein [Vibrio alginolyticus]ELB2885420.1 terminase family protein [Vibrio alginolyticus]MBS9861427.1 terminase family protein [Vibrio alginolyticus]